jgi:hypothetical protein
MSGGGSTRSTTTTELSDEQRQLLDLVIPVATDISQNPPELFPGSSIAPFNPLQLAAQQDAVDAATGQIAPLAASTIDASQAIQGTAIPAGTQGLGSIIGGLETATPTQNFLLSGALLDPATNPVLGAQTSAAIRPLAQSLATDVLPNVRGEAVQAGQFGGSRQGIAEGLAIRDFTQQAGDIATNLQANNFNQGLAAMLSAFDSTLGAGVAGVDTALSEGVRSLFAAPTLADLSLQAPSVVESVGSLQRGLEQAQLTEEADRFMTEQLLPFLIAQDVANLAFGTPGGSATTQSSQGGSSALDIIGTVLPLILGGASVFSDRQLKRNVTPIGAVRNGLPMYAFRWIGDQTDQIHFGAMADEVEERTPNAVTTAPNGYKMVNYDLALSPFVTAQHR